MAAIRGIWKRRLVERFLAKLSTVETLRRLKEWSAVTTVRQNAQKLGISYSMAYQLTRRYGLRFKREMVWL